MLYQVFQNSEVPPAVVVLIASLAPMLKRKRDKKNLDNQIILSKKEPTKETTQCK